MTKPKTKPIDPTTICKLNEIRVVKNVRDYRNPEADAELRASVERLGVLQPLLVRPAARGGGFELVCGHRRFDAAKAAKLGEVPVMVREMTDAERDQVQLVENLQREDIDPVDEALGLKQLVENGMSVDEIAVELGCKKGAVYARMKLAEAPAAVLTAMRAGDCPASVAELIARIPSEKLRDEAADEILNHAEWDYSSGKHEKRPLTFREAKRLIHRKYMTQLKGAPFDRNVDQLVDGVGPCSSCPKRTGNQKDLFGDVGRADICTDPICFNNKARAGAATKLDDLAAKGYVLGDPDKLMPHGYVAHHYVKADDPCPEDRGMKPRTYAQLIGEHAQRYAVHDPCSNRVHVLYKQSAVLQAMRDAGHKRIAAELERVASVVGPDRQHREQKKIDTAVRSAQVARLIEKVETGPAAPTLDVWAALAAAAIAGGWHETLRSMCARRGLKKGRDDNRPPAEMLRAHLNQLKTSKQLLAFIVEIMSARHGVIEQIGGAYKLDMKKIASETRSELRAAARKKKAAKKKVTKKAASKATKKKVTKKKVAKRGARS